MIDCLNEVTETFAGGFVFLIFILGLTGGFWWGYEKGLKQIKRIVNANYKNCKEE